EPVTGEDEPSVLEHARALGNGHGVRRKGRDVVPGHRRVAQPLSAEVRDDGSSVRPHPARDGRPRPRGLEAPGNEQDAGAAEQRRENGLRPDETLYGLYEGVPLDEWGGDSVPVPSRIVLFRLPLEEDFPDPDELADEVRVTILHELAHHLGIEDEDRLAQLG